MDRNKNRQKQVEEVNLLPEKHILRAIDKATDFKFIYDEVVDASANKHKSKEVKVTKPIKQYSNPPCLG